MKKDIESEKYRKKRNHKIIVILIFLAAFIVFCLPSIIRWYYIGNPSIIGIPTTMHTRIAQDMASGNFNWYDPLSFGGREYTYQPFFSMGIALFSFAMPIEWAGLAFVSLFGALALVSIYLILNKFYSKKRASIVSLIILLTPGFIFLYCHVSSRGPPIALSLLALYYLIEGKRYKSGVLLGIAGLFHIEVILFFSVIFFIYSYPKKSVYKILIIAGVIAALWYLPFVAYHGLPPVNGLYEEYRERKYSLESPTIENYFYDIYKGGYLTIGFAALAIYSFIKTDKKYLRYWAVFSFILTLFAERFFMYLPIMLSFLVADVRIPRKRNKIFKILLALFFIYILFFGAAKVWQMADDYPKKYQYDALMWIRNNTPKDAVIFSDWQWGHWISGLGERKNFIDGYAEYAPNATERLELLNAFFKTCEIPQGYNISYIYMERWFVNENNITCLSKFSMVYNDSGLNIYRI